MKHLFLRVIAPACILIPLVAALVFRKKWTPALRVLFYYLVFAGLINLISTIMATYRINNLPLLHLYTAVEFCAIAYVYYLAPVPVFARRIFGILLILFPLLCLLNVLFLQPPTEFNSNVRTLESILIAGISLFYLGRTVAGERDLWSRDPYNWISMGLLLYFSGSLFLFSFANLLIEESSAGARLILWNLHGVLVVVMYLFIAKAYQVCKS